MMRFDFATAARIAFGAGALADAAPQITRLGRKALIVTGKNPARAAVLTDLLVKQGLPFTLYATDGEPTIADAQHGAELARANGCEVVIGFGGGSALDCAKAIAALTTNQGDPLDYLEVIGKGQALTQPPLPFVAIPTTAGTGSEVTSNAVLASPEHRVKVSLRSPAMLAKLAIVDPTLTYSSPPDVTAASGLDALTQVLEPYVSNKANPVTDALCSEGMQRAAWALKVAYERPEDAAAREDMALVSVFGGIALSNAKLGAVHGFAGPLGGMFDAPHGAICARLLPYVMQANVRALQQRAPDSPVLRRYDKVAQFLTGRENAKALEGVAWAFETCTALNVPPLRRYGLTEAHFAAVAEKSAVSSSMQGNPIKLQTDELYAILSAAL